MPMIKDELVVDPNQPEYVEVSTQTLKNYLEGMLSPSLVENHSISEILPCHDGYLIVLKPDIGKKMSRKSRSLSRDKEPEPHWSDNIPGN